MFSLQRPKEADLSKELTNYTGKPTEITQSDMSCVIQQYILRFEVSAMASFKAHLVGIEQRTDKQH